MLMPEVNFFETLGFEEQFNINLDILSERFKALQKEVHPDNFVNATEQEKQLAEHYSATINEAFIHLKEPLLRAIHLLAIRGVDIKAENTTEFSPDFLMAQMEIREKLDEVKTESNPEKRVNEVLSEVEQALNEGLKQLHSLLLPIQPEALEPAAQKIRELLFYTSLKKKYLRIIS